MEIIIDSLHSIVIGHRRRWTTSAAIATEDGWSEDHVFAGLVQISLR